MNVQARLQEDRRKTNPVFNHRKLKLADVAFGVDQVELVVLATGIVRQERERTTSLGASPWDSKARPRDP